ncbi:MAG: hypothetical protein IIW48_10090 [Clostridia bacterium]|nr:hypothetical protein [Clostridia bacterium]
MSIETAISKYEKKKRREKYLLERGMSREEIIALRKQKQIEILAQLNDVNRFAIESALERSGILKRKGDKFVRVY